MITRLFLVLFSLFCISPGASSDLSKSLMGLVSMRGKQEEGGIGWGLGVGGGSQRGLQRRGEAVAEQV